MTTQVNRRASRTTMASRRGARPAAHGPAREARIRRSFDGLVASYIRELSVAGDTTRARERGSRHRTCVHPAVRLDRT
jgi:hypothetical protein